MVPKTDTSKPFILLLPVLILALACQPSVLASGDDSVMINRLEVRNAESGDEVIIGGDDNFTHSAFLLSDPDRLVLDIPNAKLAVSHPTISGGYHFLQTINTRMVTDGDKELVRIELILKENAPYEIKAIRQGVKVALGNFATGLVKESADAHSMTSSLPQQSPSADESSMAMKPTQPTSGSADATSVYGLTPPTEYKGKPIFLDLKDADILDIFRLIAEVSGFNVVVDPDVRGRITIRMDNVPWDQALDVILKNQSLGKEIDGNVMRIARNEQIRDENAVKAQMDKAKRLAVPLETVILYLSYADIQKMEENAKIFLSERGQIMKDERVNALIIRDIRHALDQITEMVKVLDVRTRQVVLESQIVLTSKDFTRSLGIAWGGKFIADAAHGNTTGYRFPNKYSVSMTGSSNATYTHERDEDDPDDTGYAVNLPNGANLLALSFGNVMDTLRLNMLLTASESEGLSKTISRPRVTTANNEDATLTSGQDIPYDASDGDSVNTNFESANTSISVTPHITNDNWIGMELNLTRDFPGATTGSDTKPRIFRNQASTKVLVKDGDTLVIGGLNESISSVGNNKIPWLGDIPILGWLFKNDSRTNAFQDLLFFITPRILEEGEQVVRTEAM